MLGYLDRQNYTVADRALMPTEELDVSDQPEPDRHNAVLCWPGAALMEQVPKAPW